MKTEYRRRGGVLTTPDRPHCVGCKEEMYPSNEFSSVPDADISGSVQVMTCPECSMEQNVCPLIEWQTWEE